MGWNDNAICGQPYMHEQEFECASCKINKLKELLKVARCPDALCDGRGFSVRDGEQHQCEWCHERDSLP